MSDFDKAISFVLDSEGGFTTDSNDSGNWTGGAKGMGELRGTKYGIAASSHPNINIISLTKDEAKQIYKDDFWPRIRGELLPWPLNYLVLDFAINSGATRAISCLQSVLGCTPDGVIGPNTLEKITSCENLNQLCLDYCSKRLNFLRKLPNWPLYGRGWANRIEQVKKNAELN